MESGSLSLSIATPSEHFESLKKAARKYESQAYTKLTEYGRLAQQTVAASHHAIQQQQHSGSASYSPSSSSNHSSSAYTSYSSASTATSDSSSLLVSSPNSSSLSSTSPSAASVFASLPEPSDLERDISDLLAKLASTTDEMSRSLTVDGASSGSTETNQYTVQRYRAILHDYNSDFRKNRENISHARQRAELLLSAEPLAQSAASSSAASSLRPRTEQLLREKGSLHNSLRLTDELLSTAAASHSNLLQQSSSLFHTIRGKVSGLRARYPAVSSLISRIERQRRKDVIVMGSVIAACICFTSLYIINKPA